MKLLLLFPEKTEEPNQRPIDCKDVKLHKGNGVYKIYPDPLEPGFDVYCDFETDNGGWTVINFIESSFNLIPNIY